jgi:hypothetical protein
MKRLPNLSVVDSKTNLEGRHTLAPAYGGKSTRQRWAQECAGLGLTEREEKGTVPFFN